MKILDFGLAKLIMRAPESGLSNLKSPVSEGMPTLVQSTQPGTLMGTPGYMAPEQLRGQTVDARSDLFSFGCVLYEMVSGRRVFRRETTADTVSAVLHDIPPGLTQVNSGLARLVERCLEKQPARRFQSAQDLAFALEALSSSHVEAPGHGGPGEAKPRDVLAASIVLVLLLMIGAAYWSLPRAKTQTGEGASRGPSSGQVEQSVAVLPFVNRSPDRGDEYLSDGLTKELVNALARVQGLRVPGRSSSFAFKGKSEEGLYRKVGEQLKVSTVLEGSMRKAGDKLRITAQLIKVADGFPLWSDTYDRDMTNIFFIQSDIATRVANALRLQLLGETSASKNPTADVEAYKLYLRGRQLWNRRTAEAMTQAIESFNQAIGLDASYALAYAGLADCYVLLDEYAGLPAHTSLPKARTAALKAIELDATLSAPHAALGHALGFFEWKWAAAEEELRRAILLNPTDATAYHWSAANLEAQRRFDEALRLEQQAREMDPLSPVINASVAWLEFECGHPDEAIAALQKQVARDPEFVLAHSVLGQCWLAMNHTSEALQALEKAEKASPNDPSLQSYRALALAHKGAKNEAGAILARLQRDAGQGLSVYVLIGLVQNALGDEARAFDALDRAVERRESGLGGEFASSPLWKELRQHPRGQAILRKMNLVK